MKIETMLLLAGAAALGYTYAKKKAAAPAPAPVPATAARTAPLIDDTDPGVVPMVIAYDQPIYYPVPAGWGWASGGRRWGGGGGGHHHGMHGYHGRRR